MASITGAWDACRAGQVLVADRLTNSVYRYGLDGTFLGLLLTDNTNLNQPAGMALSPDQSKLYVASSQNNQVVQYDYDRLAGTATNPFVFDTTNLAFPNRIITSADGSIVYVSNLGGTGVARFNAADGTSAGPAINGAVAGGSIFQFSGLAYAPDGDLLVGGFQNFPAGDAGAVARSDDSLTTIGDFIGPSAGLNGAGDILVLGNGLYVTAGFSGGVSKFDATTGAVDGAFTPIGGLAFPASLIAPPDNNGLLVGQLGFADGTGSILRYDFDGTSLGTFASAQANPALGFTEPTAMVAVVPEPSGIVMLSLGGIGLIGLVVRRRRQSQR